MGSDILTLEEVSFSDLGLETPAEQRKDSEDVPPGDGSLGKSISEEKTAFGFRGK